MTAATIATHTADTSIMIGRSLRHSARDVETLMTAIMLPIALMLLFVFVFGRAMHTGTVYVDYVVPGVLVLCAGFGAGSTATAVATDMKNGIIDRFRSMPISSASLLTGHVTASIARNVIATALVVGVALAIGWRPTAGPLQWVAAAALITFYITAISWLAAAVGIVARSVEAANAFTFVFMFLPYVSSAFVPTETLPTALRGFAEYQPATPVIETLRGLWMGTEIGGHEWWAIGWCAGLLAIGCAGSVWLYRKRLKRGAVRA